MEKLSNDYTTDITNLRRLLRIDDNFDILEKRLIIGGQRASLFFIDGFVKDEILEKILAIMEQAIRLGLSLTQIF